MAASCATTPAITVLRPANGDHVDDVKGDNIKLKRGTLEGLNGARGGFYVIRTEADWKGAWAEDKMPAMPDITSGHQMMFFAVAEKMSVTKLAVAKAVETEEVTYVYVKETKLGENCLNKALERSFDAVTVPRTDKPVKFVVETERGESCGPPPTASVVCRITGQQAWQPSLTAQPGDTVECELSAQATGKFELIDRNLSMAELPAGSTAKFAYAKGGSRAEFGVDVYGMYNVHAEAVDEIGRHGRGLATVDVKPPKTKDVLVQLVWAGFDIKDESDTFPRVNLRVAEEGAKGQRCSAEIPIPGLCEVKTRGAYTYMRIPAGARHLPVSVQYTDERLEKGPGPCVHVWFDGARTAETCDRKGRSADEIWKVGKLDTTTGTLSGGDGGGSTTPSAPTDAGTPAPKSSK